MEYWYTVSELAKRLTVSLSTAYEVVNSGEIEVICLGKKSYRITEQAVQDYIQRKTIAPELENAV